MADTMGDSFERTGHPADLLTNAHLSVGAILDTFDQLKTAWDEFTVVQVLAPLSLDPVISVERDERVTRVDLSTIRARLTHRRRGRPGVHDRGQLSSALQRWVSTLPVSDREAAARGVRLVTWADTSCATLAFDVVVARGGALAGWTPSTALTPAGLQASREHATRSSVAHAEAVECTTDGAAVIWRHPDRRLSSVIFADPDLARAYLDSDLICVYTPGFPVVGAPRTAALRLAEETMNDYALLSFRQASRLAWRK
ncbi:MAG: hypothetical protein ABI903_05275 [Actinomycetota bacterium]